ncbi:MAG: VTT domain-containing protein [Proteobacteria bacterium]|nr:VTT domain-containing protein [Pseudomonadota bacterium]
MPHEFPKTRRVWLKAGLLILILIGLYALYQATDYGQYMTRARFTSAVASVQSYALSLGAFGPVAFVGVSVAAIMAYIPAVVVIYFAVCIFGGVSGALLGAISIYLAVTAIYFTARALGRDLVLRMAGHRLSRLEARMEDRGLLAVVYLRLLFFVAPPTNWLLGLSSLEFRDVFWGTVLGTVHHIIIFAWLTDVVVEVLRTGGSLNPLETKALLLPLLVGTAVLVTVRILEKRRGKAGPARKTDGPPDGSP